MTLDPSPLAVIESQRKEAAKKFATLANEIQQELDRQIVKLFQESRTLLQQFAREIQLEFSNVEKG